MQQFSDKEREQMREYLEGHPTPEKTPKDRSAVPQDYRVLRRAFHKGVFAPPGFIWLVVVINVPKIHGVNVNVKKGKKPAVTKYQAHQLIPSNSGPEFEKGVADGLRQLIENKYNY